MMNRRQGQSLGTTRFGITRFNITIRSPLVAAVFLLLFGCGSDAPPADEPVASTPAYSQTTTTIVVYSSVNAAQVEPVLEAFTADTGIKIRLLVGDYQKLAGKLANHGRDPIADLFVGDSLASLSDAAEKDLLRPTYPDAEALSISGPLYDPDKTWFPLSVKARPIIYNTDLVNEAELDTLDGYASFRDPVWQGRLCLSSSRLAGNRMLIAMLIARYGEREAEQIVRGWRRNVTDKFYRDDTALLQALATGECQVAIADTSVLAAFVGPGRNAPLALRRFDDAATMQIDISGAAVTRHARNPDGAAVLLRWLRSATPNALYASLGNEFPVNEAAIIIKPIEPWSDLVAKPMSVSELGFLQENATKLAERAHYP